MITEHPIDRRVWTDDELLALPGHEHWRLIDGELQKMSPAGAQHGEICMRLGALIYQHVAKHRLGKTYNAETGFRLDEDNCFASDVAFVRAARLKRLLPDPEKFLQGAPDFAIEVKSPSNSYAELDRNIESMFAHGTKLIWVVVPSRLEVRVYRASLEFETFGADATLGGAGVLPGLEVPVRDIFADPVFES